MHTSLSTTLKAALRASALLALASTAACEKPQAQPSNSGADSGATATDAAANQPAVSDTLGAGDSATRARRYFNRTLGFSMAFPEGWDVKENADNYAMVGVSPEESEGDRILESVRVVFDPQPANMDIGNFAALGQRMLRETLEDYKFLGENRVAIWKYPAAKIDFLHTDQGVPTRSVMFIFLVDGRGCTITASSSPEDWARWEMTLLLICGSFEQP